jgi:hypothetical protein
MIDALKGYSRQFIIAEGEGEVIGQLTGEEQGQEEGDERQEESDEEGGSTDSMTGLRRKRGLEIISKLDQLAIQLKDALWGHYKLPNLTGLDDFIKARTTECILYQANQLFVL